MAYLDKLFLLGLNSKIKDITLPFSQLLFNNFKEIIPIGKIENFAEKVERNFFSSRIPQGILIYAKTLSRLKNKSTKGFLLSFVENVLNDTFIKERNSKANNPHLKKIFEHNAELEKKWQTSLESRPVDNETFDDSSEKYTLFETESHNDLLFCGTDVRYCCLSIYGCFYPEGLLGYILDGKYRLLAIKNSKGKIVARALLKILWDGKKPVLFLEKRYPATLSFAQEKALKKMAEDKAQELNLELYEAGRNSQSNIIIESLGSSAPFEYVDACLGVKERVYQITNSKLIYSPLPSEIKFDN